MLLTHPSRSSKRVPIVLATERDSNSATCVSPATCDFRSRAHCYEESSFRGAFLTGANLRSPLVDGERRAREFPAFFRARTQIPLRSNGLRRRASFPRPGRRLSGSIRSPRGPFRKPTFRQGARSKRAKTLGLSGSHPPLGSRDFSERWPKRTLKKWRSIRTSQTPCNILEAFCRNGQLRGTLALRLGEGFRVDSDGCDLAPFSVPGVMRVRVG